MSTAPSNRVRPAVLLHPACLVESFVLLPDGVVLCFPTPGSLPVSDGCDVAAGDRLISVNDTNLRGLSHANTVEILQNAPDDVTLVVSQPKERLYRGERGEAAPAVHAAVHVLSPACHRPPSCFHRSGFRL